MRGLYRVIGMKSVREGNGKRDWSWFEGQHSI